MESTDPRGRLRKRPTLPPAGTLIRRIALETEATYRVLGENQRGVQVEVVDAPGLQPGARFTFAVDDVIAMTDRSEGDPVRRPVRLGVPRRRFA